MSFFKKNISKNFYIFTAGFLLIAYILVFIVITISDQKKIEEYKEKESLSFVTNKAKTLEYFFSTIKNEVVNLSEDKLISTYFTNKALGMSMEYGLKANLLKIDRLLNNVVDNRLFNNKKIYHCMFIINKENQVLARTRKNTELDNINLKSFDTYDSKIYLKKIGDKTEILILKSVIYKEKVEAILVAHINSKVIFDELISKNNSFALKTKSGKTINNIASFENNPNLIEIKIKNTPFTLLGDINLEKEDTLVSKWFVIAIAFLAIPIMIALYYLVLLNNKNIKLLEQIKKSKKEKEQEYLLLQQSKVAAIGEMLNNISHQWRQPLSIISTQSTGLKLSLEIDDNFPKEKQLEILDSINEHTQYLSKTIDDFRSFFKGNSNDINEFNIVDMFNRLNALTKDSLSSNYIKVEYDIEDLRIRKNENLIIQALINILNNAKDAIVEKNIDFDERFLFITAKKSKNKLIIKIQDTGGGLKEEHLNRVFEPYFTTKHQSIGTGIGLYMTNQIITKHFKGTIHVQNHFLKINDKELKGAEFIISLSLD